MLDCTGVTLMLLANPVFLRQEPPRHVQLMLLLTLLWAALPLLSTLPVGVAGLFGVLWVLRVLLWALNIKPLSWLWLVLLLLAVGVVVWQQLGTVIGREGGVAFLLLLTVLKSYEGRGLRDWQVLLLAILVVMGGALLFVQHMAVAAWLLIGLGLLCTDMALLSGLSLAHAWRQSSKVLLLALAPALVLFVAVPRVAEPLWRIPQPPQQQASTGLSDTMQPGSISNLVQSNEPAFNATFAAGYTPRQQDLYWRVMIMADFDGRQWRAIEEHYIDNARVLRQPGSQTVAYELILRDEAGRIPALDYPVTDDNPALQTRLGTVMRVRRSREGLRRIALESVINTPLAQALASAEQAYYTRLQGSHNPQTRDLARSLRRSSRDDQDFIGQTLAYFSRQGFTYTLQPMRNDGSNSTDFFLFQSREGFCEDYANAFVLMMRAGGLPARIVTGYQGGEYNAQGQFWQVRSKDAHAWAEVWLASQNTWLRIDPTTAVAQVRTSEGVAAALPQNQRAGLSRSGWWYSISQSGQFYWQQWVVNYDASRQQNLFNRLGLAQVNLAGILALLLGAGSLAMMPLLLWWYRQHQQQRAPLSEGIMLIKQSYIDADTAQLAALGPQELRTILVQNQCLSPKLDALLQQYIQAVYIQPVLPSKRIQRRWYRQVKRQLRQDQ